MKQKVKNTNWNKKKSKKNQIEIKRKEKKTHWNKKKRKTCSHLTSGSQLQSLLRYLDIYIISQTLVALLLGTLKFKVD